MQRLSASCLFRNKWYRLLTNIPETSEMKFMHGNYNIKYLGSLNILNINVRFAIVPSPSMGEFFLQGRVRVTSPFLFQYKFTSLFFFFGLVRGECTRARGVQGKIPNAVNVCFVIILLKCQCVPALVTRSLGRLSISKHFDLVSTRCDRWQMFENYFVIIFSNVNPRTYTQIHTTRPPPPLPPCTSVG